VSAIDFFFFPPLSRVGVGWGEGNRPRVCLLSQKLIRRSPLLLLLLKLGFERPSLGIPTPKKKHSQVEFFPSCSIFKKKNNYIFKNI